MKYDNSRSFWKCSTIRPRKHVDCPVDVPTFYVYFTETHINTNQQYPISCVESLDKEITAQKVDYVITHLKRNKPPGADHVLNQCLIFGKGNLIHLITLIFNILYNRFTESWSEEIVIPIYRVCQEKKDILNIHIKSEGINIVSQKSCWIESTIFLVKCQNFTFIVQLFITYHSFKL